MPGTEFPTYLCLPAWVALLGRRCDCDGDAWTDRTPCVWQRRDMEWSDCAGVTFDVQRAARRHGLCPNQHLGKIARTCGPGGVLGRRRDSAGDSGVWLGSSLLARRMAHATTRNPQALRPSWLGARPAIPPDGRHASHARRARATSASAGYMSRSPTLSREVAKPSGGTSQQRTQRAAWPGNVEHTKESRGSSP